MAITTLANVKTVLGLTGSSKDAQITALIPLVESQYLSIRNKAFDLSGVTTVYPVGSEMTAIKMIGFLLQNVNAYGKQSESLGDYSVSYSEMGTNGYPVSITNEIKKYIGYY